MSRTLLEIFNENTGKGIHKWNFCFPIYERHLAPWKGRPVTLLEIGVQNGGSMEMWKEYLGPDSRIIGLDLVEGCAQFDDPARNMHVRIGHGADAEFLDQIITEFGPIDIVIDDGSHNTDHIQKSFEFLYPKITANGVYLIEDIGGNRERKPLSDCNKICLDSIRSTINNTPTVGVCLHDAVIVCERGEVDWVSRNTGTIGAIVPIYPEYATPYVKP